MLNPEICCLSEEEFEQKIRVKSDVKKRISDKKADGSKTADPIEEADVKGRLKAQETDDVFMKAAKLDLQTILYLEERAKYCYPLRNEYGTLSSLAACFKDENRTPIECECEVKDYLQGTNKEKAAFSDNIAKHYGSKKTNLKKK